MTARRAAVALAALLLLTTACTGTGAPGDGESITPAQQPTGPLNDDIPNWDPEVPSDPPSATDAAAAAETVFAAFRDLFPDRDWGEVGPYAPSPMPGTEACSVTIKQSAGGQGLVDLDVEALSETARGLSLTPSGELLYDAGGQTYFFATTESGDRLQLRAKTLVELEYKAVVACD